MPGKRKKLIITSVFVTPDGQILTREQLTDEQYQHFCDEFERSRLRHGIVWTELDARYREDK